MVKAITSVSSVQLKSDLYNKEETLNQLKVLSNKLDTLLGKGPNNKNLKELQITIKNVIKNPNEYDLAGDHLKGLVGLVNSIVK